MMYLSSNDKSSTLHIKDQYLDVNDKSYLMRLLNSRKYNATSLSTFIKHDTYHILWKHELFQDEEIPLLVVNLNIII